MTEWSRERLSEVLALCRGLFELSADGFVLVDREGKLLYINPSYCRQLGVTQESAVGRPVRESIPNTRIPEMLAGEYSQLEHNVLWKLNPDQQYASRERYAVVSRWVVRGALGDVIGVVGHIKFINETLRLSNAIREMNDELDYLKDEVTRLGSERYSCAHINGESEAISQARTLATKAATNDFSVLLIGESGTGKEVFANSIHYASRRRRHSIVRVNCAAIPGELFESELFGYSEGAFTGAKKGGKKGKMLLANRGTLFLDEIGEMPQAMQAKLLRVLQEQELEVVGGEAPIPIDVRIIAATNKDLRAEIEAGRFRLDLYYRLNVIELRIPPLRERPDDVLPLAESFLEEVNRKYSSHAALSPEVGPILLGYAWPGNVRELRNVVERAYMLADGGKIGPSHIMLPRGARQNAAGRLDSESFRRLKDEFERDLIFEELDRCGGCVAQCAKRLGIHRSTLYNKLAEYQNLPTE